VGLIFNDPQFASTFAPVFGGMIIKLSAQATRAIVTHHRGPKSKQLKLYIMLTLEGDLDANWPYEHSWEKVERRTKEAPLVYYCAHRKKACRPVWHQPAAARTEHNCSWERVRLIPVQRELDNTGLPSNVRLFQD
jgi:hypothetical protein